MVLALSILIFLTIAVVVFAFGAATVAPSSASRFAIAHAIER